MASNPLWAATPEQVDFLPRNAVHDMIDMLISRLDATDGDPDEELDLIEDDFFDEHPFMGPGCPIADVAELCGDESDNNGSEEDFVTHSLWRDGPGCPISDPGGTALGWNE